MEANTKRDNRVGFLLTKDFDHVARFCIQRARTLRKKLVRCHRLSDLVMVGKSAIYLQKWVEDMTHFGWSDITRKIEGRLRAEFGSNKILKIISRRAVRKILQKYHGQRHLGENEYILQNQKVYYRNLQGAWWVVDPDDVFILLPTLSRKVDRHVAITLERMYRPTTIDTLYHAWKSIPDQKVERDQLLFKSGVTTPQAYSQKTKRQIARILRRIPSLKNVDALHHEGEHYIETIIKVAYKIIAFVRGIRSRAVYPVYILRDGMLFADAHTAINLLSQRSFDQCEVMVGRKHLSIPNKPEFYWRLVVDVLYAAYRRHPQHQANFVAEYHRMMEDQEKKYPELQILFKRLAHYLNGQLNTHHRKKIVIVDTGLQGSVNMLLKHLVEYHISGKGKEKADIHMFVVGEWFKNVYKGKFSSEYYPMMKDIEVLMRSEYLYDYVPGSLEKGMMKVRMGNKKQQLLANIELITIVVLCQLMYERGLLR